MYRVTTVLPSLKATQRRERRLKAHTFGGITFTPGASVTNRITPETRMVQPVPPVPSPTPLLLPPTLPKPSYRYLRAQLALERARQILERVTFGHLPVQFYLDSVSTLQWGDHGEMLNIRFEIHMDVPERETGKVVDVHCSGTIPVPPEMDISGPEFVTLALRRYRERIHHMMLHEADEHFIYEGKRPFDPHPTFTF